MSLSHNIFQHNGGIGSHAIIDAHIAETVNPHGSQMTQTTMVVNEVLPENQPDGVTLNTLKIVYDDHVSDPSQRFVTMEGTVGDKAVTFPDGLSIEAWSGSYSIPQHVCTQLEVHALKGIVPTLHNWVSPPSFDFIIIRMNNTVIFSMSTYWYAKLRNTPITTYVTFNNLIPVSCRPPVQYFNGGIIIVSGTASTVTDYVSHNIIVGDNGNVSIGTATINTNGGTKPFTVMWEV